MFSHGWENGEPLLQEVEHIPIYELESSSSSRRFATLSVLLDSSGCGPTPTASIKRITWCCKNHWLRCSHGIVARPLQLSTPAVSGRSSRNLVTSGKASGTLVHGHTKNTLPPRSSGFTQRTGSRTSAWIQPQKITRDNFRDATCRGRFYTGVGGLERVREKLYLASMRKTTLVEDIAYSLFGIFKVAIPVIYGEGNRAVGRLPEHILTGSGDVTILAWSGRAGSYNSCLPLDLTVYHELVPPHVPQPIEVDEMVSIVTALCSSSLDLSPAMTLYDRLNKLPSPSIASSRLRLSGIVFPVTNLIHTSESNSDSNLRVYRATTAMLGDVETKTTDDLSGMEDLFLIHPWISPLLDQDFSRCTTFDETTRALRLVARLRQPFGALLLVPESRVRYRRVAADSLIMVQVREKVSLQALIDGISTVDVQ